MRDGGTRQECGIDRGGESDRESAHCPGCLHSLFTLSPVLHRSTKVHWYVTGPGVPLRHQRWSAWAGMMGELIVRSKETGGWKEEEAHGVAGSGAEIRGPASEMSPRLKG
jgi:hypothetical protein